MIYLMALFNSIFRLYRKAARGLREIPTSLEYLRHHLQGHKLISLLGEGVDLRGEWFVAMTVDDCELVVDLADKRVKRTPLASITHLLIAE